MILIWFKSKSKTISLELNRKDIFLSRKLTNTMEIWVLLLSKCKTFTRNTLRKHTKQISIRGTSARTSSNSNSNMQSIKIASYKTKTSKYSATPQTTCKATSNKILVSSIRIMDTTNTINNNLPSSILSNSSNSNNISNLPKAITSNTNNQCNNRIIFFKVSSTSSNRCLKKKKLRCKFCL